MDTGTLPNNSVPLITAISSLLIVLHRYYLNFLLKRTKSLLLKHYLKVVLGIPPLTDSFQKAEGLSQE